MVITLSGSGPSARAELDRLQKQFTEEYGQMALEKIDATTAELHELQSALTSLPFLSNKKCVIISELSQDELVFDKLKPLLEDTGDELEVILREPDIDKRKKPFKWLQANTQVTDYSPKVGAELEAHLLSKAEALGAKLERANARYLIDRLGEDEQLLNTELEKLAVFSNISKELIESHTEPSSTTKVFDLLDAAAAGNREKAMAIYKDQRAQKVEPQAILAMITWQLQMFVLAKTATASLGEVAKAAKVSEYPLKKAAQVVSRISSTDLNNYIDWALDADRAARVDYADADDATKLLILRLTSTN